MGEVGGWLVGGRKFINLPLTHHPSFVRSKTVKSKTLLDKDYAAVKCPHVANVQHATCLLRSEGM